MRVLAARILFATSALLLAAMAASLFLQVVAREFKLAVDWTEEMSRFVFIAMVFLASAYATLRRRHLRVSIVSDTIAQLVGERPVAIFHLLILVGFDAVMVWFSGYNFLEGLQFPNISPSLSFNQSHLFAVMCLGFAASALINIADLVAAVTGRNDEDLGDANAAEASDAPL